MQRIILFPRAWEFGSSMIWNKWATCSSSCSPLISCLPHDSCNIFYNELFNQVDTLVQWLALLAVTAPRLRVQSLCVALACSLSGFPGFHPQSRNKPVRNCCLTATPASSHSPETFWWVDKSKLAKGVITKNITCWTEVQARMWGPVLLTLLFIKKINKKNKKCVFEFQSLATSSSNYLVISSSNIS